MTEPELRLLLVEDNPGDARLVAEALAEAEPAGFKVRVAERLQKCQECLSRESFDVIVLDLGLPDGQGLETFERVHERVPEVPIVVLTGRNDDAVALRAIQSGAQDYLVKGHADGAVLVRSIRYAIQRKKAEEAQRLAVERLATIDQLTASNLQKSQMISTASHEIITPLAPLRLQLHLLMGGKLGPLTDEQRHAVELVDRNLERLTSLLHDTLDVAHLQSGQMRLREAPLDLSMLIQETVEPFQELARKEGLALTLHLAGPLHAAADRNRISQVIINLTSNAIKFTPPGGRVTVSAEAADGHAEIRVQDTGLGMTAEQVSRLFRPFSRVHEGGSSAAKGTGLGLYICKGIVEQHGGSIWCESSGPRTGCTFTVRLPLLRSPFPGEHLAQVSVHPRQPNPAAVGPS